MVCVDSEESATELLPRIIKSSHSRFPVINVDSDEIEGILLAKDLLPYLSSENIEDLNLLNG